MVSSTHRLSLAASRLVLALYHNQHSCQHCILAFDRQEVELEASCLRLHWAVQWLPRFSIRWCSEYVESRPAFPMSHHPDHVAGERPIGGLRNLVPSHSSQDKRRSDKTTPLVRLVAWPHHFILTRNVSSSPFRSFCLDAVVCQAYQAPQADSIHQQSITNNSRAIAITQMATAKSSHLITPMS